MNPRAIIAGVVGGLAIYAAFIAAVAIPTGNLPLAAAVITAGFVLSAVVLALLFWIVPIACDWVDRGKKP